METTTTSTPTSSTAESCDAHQAQPQSEHAWLQKLVGEWTFETECGEPGQSNQKFHGRETVKPIGALWIVGEAEGDTPGGGSASMRITLGFDPRRGRFVGTWFGSMMSHLWNYEGQLDPDGRTLTLDTEGPSFSDPKQLAKYQDIIELVSDDHRILRSRTLGADGSWTQLMTAHYHRRK